MKQGFFRHSPMLLAILLLAACAGHAQQRPAATPTNPAKASQAMNTTCKNLAPVNNIDDLLYQMHSNLDSHCLFRMPAAELERIWGIPVFDLIGEYGDSKREEQVRAYHDYRDRTGETLFVVKTDRRDGTEYFSVEMGKHFNGTYKGEFDGSLGERRFPVRLPPPDNFYHLPPPLWPETKPEGDVGAIKPEDIPTNTEHSVYRPFSNYWWFDTRGDGRKPYLEISTDFFKLPSRITLYQSTGDDVFIPFSERQKEWLPENRR